MHVILRIALFPGRTLVLGVRCRACDNDLLCGDYRVVSLSIIPHSVEHAKRNIAQAGLSEFVVIRDMPCQRLNLFLIDPLKACIRPRCSV